MKTQDGHSGRYTDKLYPDLRRHVPLCNALYNKRGAIAVIYMFYLNQLLLSATSLLGVGGADGRRRVGDT
jgi:hypothetical protein